MRANAFPLSLSWLVLAVCFAVSLHFGSSDATLWDVFKLIGDAPGEITSKIFFAIRLPRCLVAAFAGGALAGAGVISQGLFRNPLASPSVLGTTGGAGMASAIGFFLFPMLQAWWLVPVCSVIGAFLSTSFLLFLNHRLSNMSVEILLLLSFALNSLFASVTSLLMSFMMAKQIAVQPLLYWLLGGLSGAGWEHAGIASLFLLAGGILAVGLCTKLNVAALGEDIATSLGVPVANIKWQAIVVVAILVGGAVSVAGPIGFVGLLVPHFTRWLYGFEHKRLFAYSCIHGASLMLLADLLARTLWQPQEVQVGVLIAFVGGPFFLWLAVNHGKAQSRG
ncbi:MAG: FecCD family ABC transporter permease [Oligoflexales bacterium]